MAFIGNTYTTQGFVPAVDYFNGDGTTTAFTLSRPVGSVFGVQAVIENVPQNPSDAYTIAGQTITFTSAPPSGTGNIYVYYTSPIVQLIAPGQGTVSQASLGVISFYINPQTIVTSYTTPDGYNAMSAGPVAIATGVTVTVSTGTNWTVV